VSCWFPAWLRGISPNPQPCRAPAGNETRRFAPHSAAVNCVSIDASGEFVGSCSQVCGRMPPGMVKIGQPALCALPF